MYEKEFYRNQISKLITAAVFRHKIYKEAKVD